jgi:hypothetical protein
MAVLAVSTDDVDTLKHSFDEAVDVNIVTE